MNCGPPMTIQKAVNLCADYELRPAHDNPEGREPVPERGAAKKPPIAEQMKEAGRKAREQRAPDAPEKKSPSRDDR